ncbi:MAG: SyrP protein, partial [Candidatus Marinimicrobia bacterium]|nr:SyrP protein [Candidatus Neomarinimicrobiota bacterium]
KNNNKNKPVCFGDLSQINKKDIEIANNIIKDIVYDIKWQNGDIAMINNFFIMHGRRSFRGSRSILASLIK